MSSVLVICLIAMTKYLTKATWERKSLFGSEFEGESIMALKICWQEHGATRYIASANQEAEKEGSDAQFSFSYWSSLGSQPMDGAAYFKGGSSHLRLI